MRPHTDRIVVVTATVNASEASTQFASWCNTAAYSWDLIVERNEEPIGVVPAFAAACLKADSFKRHPDLIVALHDDVLISEEDWDATVLKFFDAHPKCYLAGFGGGRGLGADNIYKVPYDPMQLARRDFVSNMREAEAHGRRVTKPTRIACPDGFCIIGRAAWLMRSFQFLLSLGFVHHFYDGAIGALCARAKKEAWMIPIACHHFGGRTAVASRAYHEWAKTRPEGSDHGFWVRSHELGYNEFKDVLPVRC